jgi:hypothetical protein
VSKLIGWASREEVAQGVNDLIAAVEHIKDKGWTQLFYETEDGRCCAAGAVNKVVGDEAYTFNSRSAIACGIFYRTIGEDIATFNDAPGRTANQVIEKMLVAAARACDELGIEVPA